MQIRKLEVVVGLWLLAGAAAAENRSSDACGGAPGGASDWQSVHFAVDSAEILDETAFTLECLRTTLESNPGYRVSLMGYADRTGSPGYNVKLSDDRARSVRDWILHNSPADETRIDVHACGMQTPASDTTETRFMSRQVLIRVFDDQGRRISQEHACRGMGFRVVPDVPPGLPSRCTDAVLELIHDKITTDFVVATLPDPINSGFSREFDLFLAAARRAFEDRNYTQQSHCLPWRSSAEASGESGKKDDDSGEPDQPGIMIFRRGNEAQVLMIVGETHARGLSQQAFFRSLDFAARFGADRNLRILGPTFSGTAPYLADALGSWLETVEPALRPPSVHVVSGTATGDGLDEGPLHRLGRFEQLAAPNRQLQDALWDKFVPKHLGVRTDDPSSLDPDAVVVLVESSVYGEDFEKRGFLVSPFPMNISRLVQQYAKEPDRLALADRKPTNASKALLKLPQRTLPLRLDGRRLPGDRMPFFNPVGTTNSLDLVLARLVASISRARTQLVAIAASSTYDKIFLAQYVRARASNVRLITFEGDLLLTHPDLGRSLRGMIVASSNSMSVSEERSRLYFPSDGAHGIYDAARRLLEGHGARPSRSAAGDRVWITAVGKGSLETLAVYPRRSGSAAEATEQDDGGSRRAPRGWAAVFALATLLTFGALMILQQKASHRRSVGLGVGPLSWNPWSGDGGGANREATKRLACMNLLLIGMFIGYLLLAVPFLNYSGDRLDYQAARVIAILLLLLLGVAIFYLLANLASRTRNDSRRRGEADADKHEPPSFGSRLLDQFDLRWPLLLTLGVLGVALVVALKIYHIDQLFLRRCYDFAAGVNPLAPVMLMTAVPVGWLLLALRRFQILDEVPRTIQHSDTKPGRSLAMIRGCIGPGSLPPGAWHALLLVPLVYLAFYYGDDWTRPIRGVDQRGYDRMISVLLVGSAALSVSAGIASRRLWVELRSLLNWMATRLRPDGGTDWIERCAPSEATQEELADRRDKAYEQLQAAVQARSSTALSLPEHLLDLPEAGELSSHDHRLIWSRLIPWLAANQGAGESAPTPSKPEPLLASVSRYLTWQTAIVARPLFEPCLWLMGFMTAGLLLLLLSISAYPFEPQSVLNLWLGVLITVGTLMSVVTLVQMEGDTAVGAFTDATKGFTHGRSLTARFGLLGGVPLLSLLASQFPMVGNVLLDWLKPLLQVMR